MVYQLSVKSIDSASIDSADGVSAGDTYGTSVSGAVYKLVVPMVY